MTDRIRAVLVDEFGAPEVLRIGWVDRPVAGEGEVVVAVRYAAVNPVDLMMRSGAQAAGYADLPPPWTPGMEFAGVVHEAGPGTTAPRPGTRVFGVVDPRRAGGGAQAQFVSVPAASIAELPEGWDLAEASALPMNAITARQAIQRLELAPGATVLVTGAAGAVGRAFLSLAGAAGLRVIAHGRTGDAAVLADLGAALVVTDDDMARRVREHEPEGVDGLIDTARLGAPAVDLVRAGGSVASLRATDPKDDPRVRFIPIEVAGDLTSPQALRDIRYWASTGVLAPPLVEVLPARHAAVAHERMAAGGQRGRLVLELAQTGGSDGG